MDKIRRETLKMSGTAATPKEFNVENYSKQVVGFLTNLKLSTSKNLLGEEAEISAVDAFYKNLDECTDLEYIDAVENLFSIYMESFSKYEGGVRIEDSLYKKLYIRYFSHAEAMQKVLEGYTFKNAGMNSENFKEYFTYMFDSLPKNSQNFFSMEDEDFYKLVNTEIIDTKDAWLKFLDIQTVLKSEVADIFETMLVAAKYTDGRAALSEFFPLKFDNTYIAEYDDMQIEKLAEMLDLKNPSKYYDISTLINLIYLHSLFQNDSETAHGMYVKLLNKVLKDGEGGNYFLSKRIETLLLDIEYMYKYAKADLPKRIFIEQEKGHFVAHDYFGMYEIAKEFTPEQKEALSLHFKKEICTNEFYDYQRNHGLDLSVESERAAYNNEKIQYIEQIKQIEAQMEKLGLDTITISLWMKKVKEDRKDSWYSTLKKRVPNLTKDMYYDFVGLVHPNTATVILDEIGVKIYDFSLQEQIGIMEFLKTIKSEEEASQVKEFSLKYGNAGFRSFLSLHSVGQSVGSRKEMGDKILTLGDETKFPRPLAEKLFSKYGSFVDSANNIQEEIAHLVGDNRTLDTSKISEKLLVRAKNLLVEYADAAKVGVIDEKKIDENLEHIHQEIAVLGYAYIEMARQGDYADLEDLGKVEVTVRATTEYTTQEKDELEKVYIYSRPKETFDNKEHIELLKREFRETLDKENVTVFDVTLDNKKIAFALLYYKDPKTLHMGGLSFHPDARNPAVGLAVMESMAKNLGAYAIEAEVHSENKILSMYTNRFGFKITGEEPREKNAGELYYIIRREPTREDPRSST